MSLIHPSPSGEGQGVGRFRKRRACGDAPLQPLPFKGCGQSWFDPMSSYSAAPLATFGLIEIEGHATPNEKGVRHREPLPHHPIGQKSDVQRTPIGGEHRFVH
jgi:hypothetical protein